MPWLLRSGQHPCRMVDAGQTTRQGFKDVQMLATALGPHVSERFFTTYTTSRSNKDVEKKKLLSK